MLFIVGGADILRDETTSMTERLETEARAINQSRQVSNMAETPYGKGIVVRTDVYEGQIHGWLESRRTSHDSLGASLANSSYN